MFTVNKIIIATPSFPPESDSRANYAYYLAKELKTLGIDVKVITLWKKDACGAKHAGDIGMFCVPHKKALGIINMVGRRHYKSILKEIEDYNPQCVVTLDYFEPLSITVARATKTLSVPCICVNHLVHALSHKNKFIDNFIKRYEIKTLMLNKKHRAVFAGASTMQTNYLRKVKAVPRFEIPYGVETEIMPLPLMKKQLGIKDSAIMYLIKPNGDYEKVAKIADALDDVGKYSGPETVLVVIGDVPIKNRYDKRKVIFTGTPSPEEDISYKYGCDVYIHFTEGDALHMDLLEAGLFARASVSIAQGNFDIIESNFDGLVTGGDSQSLKEALQKLRLHKKLRHELGENFKKKVELQYNWQQGALALIDAVWELNGARRHG